MRLLFLPLVAAIAVAQVSGEPHIDIRDVAAEQAPTVHVILQVFDEAGQPAAGLTTDDFTLFEDGVAIEDFSVRQSHPEEQPVAVSIAIDTSGSMAEEDIAGAVAGANAVIDRLAPEDRLELVVFNLEWRPIKDYADDLDRSVLDGLVPDGDITKLNDTLHNAILRSVEIGASRRAIIILTDGVDERSITLDVPLIDLAAESGVAIHTVGLGDEVDADVLQKFAEASGGSFRSATEASELAGLYAEIADTLRTEYRLSYDSQSTTGDHELTVVARVGDANASATIPFSFSPTAAELSEAADDASDDSSFPVVVIVVVLIVAVLALVGLLAFARRGARAQRVEAAAVAVSPTLAGQPSAAALSSSFHLVGDSGVFPVSGPTTVGRDPRADIVVGDETVSRSHAQLQDRDDGIVVIDLGSANGTTVNGQAVSEAVAHPGDQVAFGDLTFELRAPT